jgi:hypothetical protein
MVRAPLRVFVIREYGGMDAMFLYSAANYGDSDIGPQYHPTDVGHIKLASNLIQYIKLKFDWVLYATGPEVQHDTTYWNTMNNY